MGAYKGRYYEGGISSVYLWDIDDGFAGCVLLKKGLRSSVPAATTSWTDSPSRQPYTTQLWQLGQHSRVRRDRPCSYRSLQADFNGHPLSRHRLRSARRSGPVR